jgi:hypothetical protein
VGLLSANEQVYSANVVGYYNITLPAGKSSLISVQMTTGSGDTSINAMLTNSIPDGSTLLFWNGSRFSDSQVFVADPGVWADGSSNISTNKLPPGLGAYLTLAAPATVTIVGQVPQGSATNVVGLNQAQVRSIPTPAAVGFDNPLYGKLPAADGDTLLQWNVAQQKYSTSYLYVGGANVWTADGINATNPSPAVGEAFLHFHTGAAANWVFNFTVQ